MDPGHVRRVHIWYHWYAPLEVLYLHVWWTVNNLLHSYRTWCVHILLAGVIVVCVFCLSCCCRAEPPKYRYRRAGNFRHAYF